MFADEPPLQLSWLNQHHPQFVDIDLDGDQDLIFASNGCWLYLNDGSGHFAEAPSGALPGGTPNVRQVVCFDAERDGDMDFGVLVGDFIFSEPRLWRNDGLGGLSEESIAGGPGFAVFGSMAAADFDGDGFLDLFSVLGIPAEPRIYLNDGFGQFGVHVPTGLPDSFTISHEATWADWQQDGTWELLGTAGYWQVDAGLEFSFVAWPLRTPIFIGSSAGQVVACDLDGDLDLDLFAHGTPPLLVKQTALGPVHANSTVMSGAPGPHRHLGSLQFDTFVWPGTVPSTGILSQGANGELLLTTNGDSLASGRLDRTFAQVPFAAGATAQANDAVLFHHLGYFTSYSMRQTVAVCLPTGVQVLFVNGDHMAGPTAPLAVGTPSHVAAADLLGSSLAELVFGDPAVDGPAVAVAYSSFPEDFELQPVPTLPPPPPSSAPAYESVLLDDLDGDGDLDIVHEFRVVANDGSGASWSEGARFASLLSNATERLLTIDYDSDGRRDLIAFGENAPVTLLRNAGTAFVDATFGAIPAPAIAATAQITVGDVDSDGDEDLLVVRGDRSNLLRNDGGVFVRMVDVGPAGELVDADRDGRPDLIGKDTIHWNLHSHLHAPRLAAPGTDWLLQVESWRAGALASLALVAISTAAVETEVPGLGVLHFEPSQAIYVPMPLALGAGQHALAIPPSAPALGVELVAQAALVDAHRIVLSNPVFDVVR